MVPIYELIQNATIKEEFRKATIAYMTKFYLHDYLKDTLVDAQKQASLKSWPLMGVYNIDALLARINAADNVTDDKNVNKDINNFMTVMDEAELEQIASQAEAALRFLHLLKCKCTGWAYSF